MAKYLNGTGLARAWEKIKAYVDGVFEDIPEATTTSAGLMSATDKTNVDGLMENAVGFVTITGAYVKTENVTGDTLAVNDIPTATKTKTGMMSSSDKTKLDNLVSTIGATASDGSVYAEDVAYIAATATEYGGMTVRNIPAVYTCPNTATPDGSAVLPSSYTLAGTSYTGSTSISNPASAVGTLYIDESNRRLVNLCGSTAYYGSTAAMIYTVARPGDIIYHDSHPWLAINEKGDLAEFPTTGASV